MTGTGKVNDLNKDRLTIIYTPTLRDLYPSLEEMTDFNVEFMCLL